MGVAPGQAHRSPLELSLAKCRRRTLDACRSFPLNASAVETERILERLLASLEAWTKSGVRCMEHTTGSGQAKLAYCI